MDGTFYTAHGGGKGRAEDWSVDANNAISTKMEQENEKKDIRTERLNTCVFLTPLFLSKTRDFAGEVGVNSCFEPATFR